MDYSDNFLAHAAQRDVSIFFSMEILPPRSVTHTGSTWIK